ncbi:MAG TPA: cation:proton antiporter [Nevskiaceae bacterium]|nr:cation:proton antiporter [Nevskiaceae bacterium]
MTDLPAGDAHLLLDVFLMFAAAKVLAELFVRLKQPAVVGELLAGILIGPSVLGWVAPSSASALLSEIGVVMLMFSVGLETKPSSILSVGPTAFVVAVLGVVAPFVGGWWLLRAIGEPQAESLFVGTAMVATSVGITARVLTELKVLSTRSARVVLGAAVIDDVLGLLVLAGVSGTARGDAGWHELAWTAALAIGFVVVVAALGPWLVARTRGQVQKLRADNATFVFAMLLCLGLALAAESIGVAAIIGAFLAGMALATVSENDEVVHLQTRGVAELLVPFFLVAIGLQLKLDVFAHAETVYLALGLTALAIVAKLIGCGLGAIRLGGADALRVGVGMVPRGEVGIIVAQIGLSAGIVSESLFGAVLVMVVATTLIAPPVLRPLYPHPHVNA